MQKDKNAEEGFVSRWSRRKNEGVDQREADVVEANINDTITPTDSSGEMVAMIAPDEGMPETLEEHVLTDEDMPSLESLTPDSDFSMFMSPGVSEALRRLALRKLFGRASFSIRDGLDDYDDDFRNFAALGDIITCDMKHQVEVEEERKRKEEEAAADAKAEEAEGRNETAEDSDSELQEADESDDADDTEDEPDKAISTLESTTSDGKPNLENE